MSTDPIAAERSARRRRDLASGADWRFVLFRAWLGFQRQRGVDAAAALTYLSFLALFPITLTAVSALAIATGKPGADRIMVRREADEQIAPRGPAQHAGVGLEVAGRDLREDAG